MQLSFADAVHRKYFWAFARDVSPPAKRYQPSIRPQRNLSRYYITSCSQQAKAYGVKIGMTYHEARQLVPQMRVIVCNR